MSLITNMYDPRYSIPFCYHISISYSNITFLHHALNKIYSAYNVTTSGYPNLFFNPSFFDIKC